MFFFFWPIEIHVIFLRLLCVYNRHLGVNRQTNLVYKFCIFPCANLTEIYSLL